MDSWAGMSAADDAARCRWRHRCLRTGDNVQTSSPSRRRPSLSVDGSAETSAVDRLCPNIEPLSPVEKLKVSDERPLLERPLRRSRLPSLASGRVDCSGMDRASCCQFDAGETWCARQIPFSRYISDISSPLLLPSSPAAALGTATRLQHTTFRLPLSRFARVLFVVGILIMTTSHCSVVMAAPTSDRQSPSSRAAKVFDGDPGADKNFDGTVKCFSYCVFFSPTKCYAGQNSKIWSTDRNIIP